MTDNVEDVQLVQNATIYLSKEITCGNLPEKMEVSKKYNISCEGTGNFIGFLSAKPGKDGQLLKFAGVEVYDSPDLVLPPGTKLTVRMDFRSWKYLSKMETFSQEIKDINIITGKKTGSLSIDFSKMIKLDKNEDLKFEVGGRLYWEIYVVPQPKLLQTYVTNGFFDREGYVEPTKTFHPISYIIRNYSILVAFILLILICICC